VGGLSLGAVLAAERRENVVTRAVFRHIIRAVFLCGFMASDATRSERQSPPDVTYWHAWTDGNGVSHQTRRLISGFSMEPIASGTVPQWLGPSVTEEMRSLFTVLPAGWTCEWHENPAPQWIIPISGKWGVETMDGTKVVMGPGEISLGQDQGSKLIDGRRGHRSWVEGNEPAVLMLFQLGDGFKLPSMPNAA